jgi:hypothetical protein
VGRLTPSPRPPGLVVKSTAEFGGDLKLAAEGVVEGAIAGAKDLGLNVGEAASGRGKEDPEGVSNGQ